VLPDENDCVKLFKAVRISKYVAQENIVPLPYPRRCTHRVLPNYFEGYDPITGRHAIVTASCVHLFSADMSSHLPCETTQHDQRV